MPSRHATIALAALAALIAGLALAAAAAAAPSDPGWSLRAEAEPTSFGEERGCEIVAPAECDHYTLLATNVGGERTEGTVTISAEVPAGLAIATSGLNPVEARSVETKLPLSCSVSGREITCTYPYPVQPDRTLEVRFVVEVEPSAPTGRLGPATASVEGGGASPASAEAVTRVRAPQPFAVGELPFDVYDAGGAAVSQAGAHPYAVASGFGVTTDFEPGEPGNSAWHISPTEDPRDALVYLPQGLVGDPTAAPTCSLKGVFSEPPQPGTSPTCAEASRVGNVAIQTEEGGGVLKTNFESGSNLKVSPLFNVAPEDGYPAEFAFTFYHQLVTVHADLVQVGGRGGGYALRVGSPGIPAGQAYRVHSVLLTFFGNPAERNGGAAPSAAFLRNPTNCSGGPLKARIEADSWQSPGDWVRSESTVYPQVTGCDKLQFQPSFQFEPDVSRADTPFGYGVKLRVPQAPNRAPALATPDLRDVEVALPEGVAISPSAANGLGACPATGPRGINIGTDDIGPSGADLGNPWATELGAGHPGGNSSPYDDGVYHAAPGRCPDASRIGDLEISTPLLEAPLTGHVYVAAPRCGAGPCTDSDAESGRLYGIYLEASGSGAIVKLRGEVTADPRTGQLTATFTENPQLPFEEFRLDFYGGPGAVLANPQTCDTFTTHTRMTPWSAPQTPTATPSSSFGIDSGPGSHGCHSEASDLPNDPSLSAGTVTPLAGSYSHFVLRLHREDGTQRIKSIDATLPPGLTGRLAGIPYCSEHALDVAGAKSGRSEQDDPSCPDASKLGEVTVGAGPGPEPYYVDGDAYLAGPYEGAPISLAIVTPAVAGPYDLGTVVVRTALHVNPVTARITAQSDEIPHILAGTPLDVRSIAVKLDRENFTLNPTSCEEMSVRVGAASLSGGTADLANPFRVGGCRALDFKPRLRLRLFGGVRRTKYQGLRAVVRAQPGDANIGRAVVRMPHSAFVAQEHLNNICTRVQFRADACPKSSVYGHAVAYSPLLGYPLRGNVYLRSSDDVLPNLVADLRGPGYQPIRIELAGRIDSVKGALRTTFDFVPDAPVSFFRMQLFGGKKGLIINSRNICKGKNLAGSRFDAHNGRRTIGSVPVTSRRCGLLAKKRRGARRAKRASLAHRTRGR